MASGYYQLEVAEEDRDKTAFVTKYGLFSFRIMRFELCNAPATFSRLVSLVLRGLSWKSVAAVLDDVAILGRDFDIHMVNLSDVLRRFEQYGIKLKLKKCQLLLNSVVFLGRLVSREGVQVPSGIGNWGVPLCKRDVPSFIGVLHSVWSIFQSLHWWKNPCMILWDLQLHSDGVQSKRRHLINCWKTQSLHIQFQKMYLSWIQMPRIMILELNCNRF